MKTLEQENKKLHAQMSCLESKWKELRDDMVKETKEIVKTEILQEMKEETTLDVREDNKRQRAANLVMYSVIEAEGDTLQQREEHVMEDLINFSENGAEGLEIRKEEVVTPKEDDTSPEQYERLDRMIQLEQEVERTKMALELLLKDKGGEKVVRRPVRSLVRPRDIRMLNLIDFQGIEAEGRLKVFFSQVKSCSEDLEERKRILMARVDPPLA
ncbi:hypothetical protein GWK47_017701 [Chionoecetes opilio]|uniref:Uncharacterized protein n=1 Tax=Chionoecetes opilio TaxID=41210 RepID=A0A8J4XRD5_CHIOP|nr:hypothetical protein GWK47_017701 [Chionoecetes opilio]